VKTLTEPRELPVPFDRPENIVALVKGEKTQTRRVMRPQPKAKDIGVIDPYNKDYRHFTAWTQDNKMILGEGNIKGTCHWRPPYGVPGDLLWVREALVRRGPSWYYKADGRPVVAALADQDAMAAWVEAKASNHCTTRYMPRLAARIFLRVMKVHVERLWDINEAEARAEGVMFDGQWWRGGIHKIKGSLQCWPTARDAFRALWNTMHGDRATQWAKNPWVWTYTFTVNVVDRM
jgi:hypothetical protein